MALPLISFVRDGSPKENPNPHYSAQLIEATVRTLSASFSSVQVCHPFFASGSLGKNSVLAALLRQPESCFECGDSALDGVYVWPEPVLVGEVTFLLIKMRRAVDASQKNYMELRKKVRMVLALLSSVCCLCEERSTFLAEIDTFFQDYHPVSQQLHLEICRLQVFMEKSWFKLAKEKTELKQRLSANESLLDRVFRERYAIDDSWLPSLVALLADQTNPFIASHKHFWRETNYLPSFLHWTAGLVELANLNLTFPTFVSKLPDTTDPEALVSTLVTAKRVDAFCHNADHLDFIIKTGEEQAAHYAFAPTILESLQRNYEKLNDPIVILVFMGPPGKGKSTLLNYIIQFCIGTLQLPSIFDMGNTCKHITKGSQVLSHPLFYKEEQIMLMDLEGLGGTEIQDIDEVVMQANLISALLTVASVPCILIENTSQSKRFVEKTVGLIAKLQLDFGFYTERIHLLFHDRILEADSNLEFMNLATDLNRRHFERREVVKVLKKPNFKDESVSDQRQLFLSTLLDDSLYTKKSALGVPAKIQDILTLINVISTHNTTDLKPLQLSLQEKSRMKEFVNRKIVEMKTMKDTTQSRDNSRLLIYFNETITCEFSRNKEEELRTMSENFRKICRERLDLELQIIRWEVARIEACNSFLRVIPTDLMQKNIEVLVNYFYKSSWSISGFHAKVDGLCKKLEQIRHHFPESSQTIETILVIVNNNIFRINN